MQSVSSSHSSVTVTCKCSAHFSWTVSCRRWVYVHAVDIHNLPSPSRLLRLAPITLLGDRGIKMWITYPRVRYLPRNARRVPWPGVCLSVRLSRSWIRKPKREKLFYHLVAHNFSFSTKAASHSCSGWIGLLKTGHGENDGYSWKN